MNLKAMLKRQFPFLLALKQKMEWGRVLPRSACIDISNNCNAACPFCARQVSGNPKNGLMAPQMFESVVEQLSQIKSVKHIVLAAWGEPLLHPHFDAYLDLLHSQGYTVGFPTNFSLAHKHFDSLLKAQQIMLSIEGHDKESYEKKRVGLSFDKVHANVAEFDQRVKLARSKGRHTPVREINCLLQPDLQIDAFMETWLDLVDIVRIGPTLPVLVWNNRLGCFEAKNPILPLSRPVPRMYCSQPFTRLTIRANGKLALCCTDYDSALNFGNTERLQDAFFQNPNLNRVRDEFRNKNLEVCKNCFQNFEMPQAEMFALFPELEKYRTHPKVVIYGNR
jgi:organic radical activating enzyme